MPTAARPTAPRRLRPSSPRCRGGASSLLRLAGSPAGGSVWLGHAAALGAVVRQARRPAPALPEAVFDGTIITRLLPSHELVGR